MADVTNKESCEAAAKAVLQTFARIDVLVNNAGITQPVKTLDITGADYDRVLDVSLRGTLYMKVPPSRFTFTHSRGQPRHLFVLGETMSDLSTLEQSAYRIRRYALRMGEVQGQGYIGQALGWADVLATAYCHAMAYRASEPEWEGRDRFLLSHGHYAIAHYAALIEAGIVPESELETYGSDDSRLPMDGLVAG